MVKMKQYSIALHLFEETLQRDAPVNHNSLSFATDCDCKLKGADFGSAIFGGFFKRGYEVTFITPIKRLLSVGRVDGAAELLKKLMTRNCVNLMKLRCSSIIERLCNLSRWNEALDWLKLVVADRLCNLSRWNEALHRLKQTVAYHIYSNVMQSLRWKAFNNLHYLDEATCNILLDGMLSVHLIAEAFSVLHSMGEDKRHHSQCCVSWTKRDCAMIIKFDQKRIFQRTSIVCSPIL